jgi:predicted DNA-binding protein (UPF0251 family)
MVFMMMRKGTEMSKTVNVSLTPQQIEVLRGVMFEYYSQNEAFDVSEEKIRQELEEILADAEEDVYLQNFLEEL